MLKKQAFAIQEISKEFMGLNRGDKIETVKCYSEKFSLSVGTISKAINEIQLYKGVELEKKGYLGTFIQSQDYKKLWELIGLKNIICVMPLPYLKRYEGLASGIKKNMKNTIFFAYIRGANRRMEFLESNNYHCAILSKLAALEYIKENKNVEIAFEFGKRTYMGEHIIVHRHVKIKRVGVDKNSKDHMILTKTNFPKNGNYEFIDINYSEILGLLKRKEIDGAIWNLDNLLESKIDVPYKQIQNNINIEALGEAVIVVKKDEKWLTNFLKKELKREEIILHQNGVINKKIVPTY